MLLSGVLILLPSHPSSSSVPSRRESSSRKRWGLRSRSFQIAILSNIRSSRSRPDSGLNSIFQSFQFYSDFHYHSLSLRSWIRTSSTQKESVSRDEAFKTEFRFGTAAIEVIWRWELRVRTVTSILLPDDYVHNQSSFIWVLQWSGSFVLKRSMEGREELDRKTMTLKFVALRFPLLLSGFRTSMLPVLGEVGLGILSRSGFLNWGKHEKSPRR